MARRNPGSLVGADVSPLTHVVVKQCSELSFRGSPHASYSITMKAKNYWKFREQFVFDCVTYTWLPDKEQNKAWWSGMLVDLELAAIAFPQADAA